MAKAPAVGGVYMYIPGGTAAIVFFTDSVGSVTVRVEVKMYLGGVHTTNDTH
jgi:hypothetical protein